MGDKPRIRVYKLARELGLSSKEVIERLDEAGFPVISHSSSVVEAIARAALSQTETSDKELPSKAESEAEEKPSPKAPEEIPGIKPGPISLPTSLPTEPLTPLEAETPAEPLMELEPPQVNVHPSEAPVMEESALEEEQHAPETQEAVTPTEPSEVEGPVSPAIALKPGLEPELIKRVADELGFDVEEIPRTSSEGDDPSSVSKVVRIPEMVTVRELAEKLAVSPGEIIKELKKMGVVATADWSLNPGESRRIAGEFGFDVELTRVEIELLEILGDLDLGEVDRSDDTFTDQDRAPSDDLQQRMKQGLVRLKVKEEREEKEEEEQGQAAASRGTITIAEETDRDSDWSLPSGPSQAPAVRQPIKELLLLMGGIVTMVLLALTMPRQDEAPPPVATATIALPQAQPPGPSAQSRQWKIIRYSPRAGQTDQSRQSVIQIFFNRPVKQDVVEKAFSIDPGEPGTFSWPKPNRLVFTPKESLLPGTEYTVSLKPIGGTQPDGEHTLPGTHWSFITGGIRTYRNDIKPLVAAYCSKCHGPKGPAVGTRFETYADVSKYVVAGRSEKSRIYTFIQSRKNHVNPWPREWGHANSDKLAIIKDWIDEDFAAE